MAMLRLTKREGLALAAAFAVLWGGGCKDPSTIGEACELLPGDLVITEVMPDPNGDTSLSDDGYEWFEVYNPTSEAVSLNRVFIWRESYRRDGTLSRRGHVIRNADLIPPGGYYVLGDGEVGVAPIDYSYDQERNDYAQYSPSTGWGENLGELTGITGTYEAGGLVLECRGRVVDRIRYGALGAPIPTKGQSLYFDGDLGPDALLNDRGEYWCSGGDAYDDKGNRGSPGEANQRCGLVRCQEGGLFRDGNPPAPGELVITEVLIDPLGNADSRKFWIEVFVNADEPVDLNDLFIITYSVVPDDEGDGAFITDTDCITAQPGEYVVIAESSGPDLNGGVTDVRAQASGLAFSTNFKDEGGTIAILTRDPDEDQYLVVDQADIPPRIPLDKDLRSRVECIEGEEGIPYETRESCLCWDPDDCPVDPSLGRRTGCTWDPVNEVCGGGGGRYKGRTFNFDQPALELDGAGDLNDAAVAFCYTPDIPATEGHFDGIGTPGLPGYACGTVACCPSACCDASCSTAPDTRRAVRAPAPGDLVITEAYASAEGADVNKEWIEVYVANGPVDVNGLWVWHEKIDTLEDPPTRDADLGRGSSSRCAVGETGDYLVVSLYAWQTLLLEGPVADNSGVSPDLIATTSEYSQFLDNSPTDGVEKSVVIAWGHEELDAIPLTFAPEGVTQMLVPEVLDPVGNDDVEAFCEPIVTGLFEGQGTPGLPNVCGAACFVPGELGCNDDCTLDTSGCYGRPTWCGDGVAAGDEACDGVDLRGADCLALGYDDGILTCRVDCRYDTSGCQGDPQWCGNGNLDFGEACDGAALGGATCFSQGFVGGGTLACTNDCTFDTAACLGTGPVCGNGVLEPGEICDGDSVASTASCVGLGFGGGLPRAPVLPAPGDLVINEIYADPDGSDAGRDWLEVVSLKSPGQAPYDYFDLNALVVRSHTLSGSNNVYQWRIEDLYCATVGPGEYAVIAGPSAASDGVVANATIGSASSGLFYNGEMVMEICLDLPDSPDSEYFPCTDLIDAAAALDGQSGASWAFDQDVLDSPSLPDAENDVAGNWCLSTSSENGFLQNGSPGVRNTCP